MQGVKYEENGQITCKFFENLKSIIINNEIKFLLVAFSCYQKIYFKLICQRIYAYLENQLKSTNFMDIIWSSISNNFLQIELKYELILGTDRKFVLPNIAHKITCYGSIFMTLFEYLYQITPIKIVNLYFCLRKAQYLFCVTVPPDMVMFTVVCDEKQYFVTKSTVRIYI